MKISGFSLVRNGSRFDYPYLESFRSMLPLVDELIINVGSGDDDTLNQLQIFAKSEGKVRLFQSDWPLGDPEKNRGGLILSEQTNLALDQCSHDWCIYLQADEVLHEDDLPQIRMAIEKASQDPVIEGLLFDYIHFYGSFDVIQMSRSSYRREVRVIRKSSGARSVGDAQSFRKKNEKKMSVIQSGARVFHYGWVRSPEAMREKTFFMDQLYHGAPKTEHSKDQIPHTGDNYRYKRFWGLMPFTGSHPAVMRERIRNQGWKWDLANSPFIWSWRDLKKIPLDLLERMTGHRFFEYRCYSLKRNR